jgi:hypothetical protein
MLNFNPDELLPENLGEYSWGSIVVRTDPSSYDYLSFARQDLKDGKTSRHLINALSNTKRALHLRLEDMCLGFGSRNLNSLKKFPQLLDYLRSCGVVSPNVLELLNKRRNQTEHDYDIPDLMSVEIFIDVTELFLVATDRWRDRQPCTAEYTQEIAGTKGTYRLIGLDFDWRQGIATINYREKDAKSFWDISKIEFRSPSTEFFRCASFLISNNY